MKKLFVSGLLGCMALLMLTCTGGLALAATPASATENSIQMMDAFDKNQAEKDDGVTPLNDHTKKLTMFFLGLPLLILVLCTGAVGIAMGIFGKPWFVLHMILAGLSMTLALVHAIVGIAWFYPF